MRRLLIALLVLTCLLLLPSSVAAFNEWELTQLTYVPVTDNNVPIYFNPNNCENLAITVPGSAFGDQAGNTITGFLAPLSAHGLGLGNIDVENWVPNADGTYTLNINPCEYNCPAPGTEYVEYQLYIPQTDAEGNTIYVPVGTPFRFYLTNVPPES